MAPKKTREVWEFGDFQTPLSLTREVCQILPKLGISPGSVLEPTCGHGAFLQAAAETFPDAQIVGVEINPEHLNAARSLLSAEVDTGRVNLFEGDFFKQDWSAVLEGEEGPWLILGNPPWVTSAELGMLEAVMHFRAR